jgi:hypothetical protein
MYRIRSRALYLPQSKSQSQSMMGLLHMPRCPDCTMANAAVGPSRSRGHSQRPKQFFYRRDSTLEWSGPDAKSRCSPPTSGSGAACRMSEGNGSMQPWGEGGWCYSRPPAEDERRFRGLPSPPAVAPDALSGSGHWGLALGLALTGPVTLQLCSSAPVPRHGNRSFPQLAEHRISRSRGTRRRRDRQT